MSTLKPAESVESLLEWIQETWHPCQPSRYRTEQLEARLRAFERQNRREGFIIGYRLSAPFGVTAEQEALRRWPEEE